MGSVSRRGPIHSRYCIKRPLVSVRFSESDSWSSRHQLPITRCDWTSALMPIGVLSNSLSPFCHPVFFSPTLCFHSLHLFILLAFVLLPLPLFVATQQPPLLQLGLRARFQEKVGVGDNRPWNKSRTPEVWEVFSSNLTVDVCTSILVYQLAIQLSPARQASFNILCNSISTPTYHHHAPNFILLLTLRYEQSSMNSSWFVWLTAEDRSASPKSWNWSNDARRKKCSAIWYNGCCMCPSTFRMMLPCVPISICPLGKSQYLPNYLLRRTSMMLDSSH